MLQLNIGIMAVLLNSWEEEDTTNILEETAPGVEWIELDPPPGFIGPCFAYFLVEDPDTSYSDVYTGTVCKD
jgi:hypothetical protein